MPDAVARNSIATRLFISAAVWSVVIMLLGGIALSTLYSRSTVRAFDERLGVYVRELIADLSTPAETDRETISGLGEPRFDYQNSGWYWQILRLDGGERVHKASRSLYGAKLQTLASSPGQDRFAYVRRGYIQGPDERQLRILERRADLSDEGQYLVSIAAETDEIEGEIASFRLALLVTFLALGVALVVTTGFQVRYGLRPLTQLGVAVADIREGRTERITGVYPTEIAPLATELNLLLETNREILNRARTQVGNLAHALKTPLSVLVNEADIVDDPLAEKVREQAVVIRHHLDYYLNRARAAAIAGTLGTVTDVKPVIEGLVRVFTKISRDRGIRFAVTVADDLCFRGERQDFEELAGNLIDNATKWAASDVAIELRFKPESARTMLELLIDNDGPPIDDDSLRDVLARGRRLDETKPGSGLGLAIVADLAAMYGGRIELLSSPLGGVRSRLELPALARAAPQTS